MSVDFQKEVIEASRTQPVLVDFWAEWCAPCRVLGPILDKVTDEMKARVRLVKVNVDEQPEVAQPYRVSSIPKVILFADGAPIADFVGALPEREVRRFLETELPTPASRALSAAKAALAAGRTDEAERQLEAGIASDPKAHEARVLLATLRFGQSPEKAVTLVRDIPDTDAAYERAHAVQLLAELLGRTTQATEPDWQRYYEGAFAVKQGDYAAAFEAWLDLLRRKKKVDDDGPRRMLLALFQLLGEAHPLTSEYRRKFASALY